MAHRILDQMFAGKRSAWHNLGITGDHIKSAVQAVYESGMDYEIYKSELSVCTPNGNLIPFDSYGLLRGPTIYDNNYVPLGTCGADYEFYQNHEIAARIDQLASETNWEFSTAGVLGKGETIFICLDMGAVEIGGEDVDRFFTYVETRNGKTVARAFNSRVRVVCQNTLDLGLKQANSKVALRHYSEYKLDADWIMNMVAEAERSGQDIDAALNWLTEVTLSDQEYNEYLNEITPYPELPNILTMPNLTGRLAEKRQRAEYLYMMKRETISKTRSAIEEIYQKAADIPSDLKGTAWHAFQAVTHYTTHIHGTLGARGRKMDYRNRAEWDIFDGGVDMRNRAFQTLYDMK